VIVRERWTGALAWQRHIESLRAAKAERFPARVSDVLTIPLSEPAPLVRSVPSSSHRRVRCGGMVKRH